MPKFPSSYTSKFSTSTLNKVYKRGLGAYYSSGRVRSFVTGKGGARKADKDLTRKG
jgi:hypothetical protein